MDKGTNINPVDRYGTNRDYRKELTQEYKRDYNRGWRSGHGTGSGALDSADARNEPGAWYSGYYDAAAGRAKWHSPNCPAHHNDPGGCGEA